MHIFTSFWIHYICAINNLIILYCLLVSTCQHSEVSLEGICIITIEITYLFILMHFTDTKPDKYMFLNLLSPVSAQWDEIGGLLGVDPNTINGLHTSNLSNQVKLDKMLQSWFNMGPTPVTWNNIISVLEGPLKNKSLANEICKTLGIKRSI